LVTSSWWKKKEWDGNESERLTRGGGGERVRKKERKGKERKRRPKGPPTERSRWEKLMQTGRAADQE
jgi:hypothetical protein